MLDQLCGDTRGSLVEFKAKEEINRQYPNGVRLIVDCGHAVATGLMGEANYVSQANATLLRNTHAREIRCGSWPSRPSITVVHHRSQLTARLQGLQCAASSPSVVLTRRCCRARHFAS